MIDRITDAGQCDYYEVIIKVIKQGLSVILIEDLPLIKEFIVNNIGLPTSEFDWLGMKEKPYLIALVCDLSNLNMERKKQ